MQVGLDDRGLPAVPGFQLVRRVGRGGMGEVFHAVRVGPGGFRKSVALKQLIADQALSGRARARFFEEAQLSAQLEHANLVRVHDVVVAGNQHFMVMELLRGLNLVDVADALRSRGAVPWWLALSVAAQALDGLAHAHAAVGEDGRPLGLVHRDLTPRNLFLCAGGAVKILDFGIAKRHDGPSLTRSGHIHGTIEFLSPEQARGERACPRSDLYQLGATLYWLLSGRFPHGEGTAGEIIARAAAGQPTPLAELAPDLPPAVTALIARAMAAAPAERFADAAAMAAAVSVALELAAQRGAAALATVLAELPLPGSDDTASGHTISATGEGTAAVVAPSAATPADATAPSRPRRRSWIWIAAALVVATGFAVGLLVGRRAAPGPEEPAPAPAVVSAGPTWQQLPLDPGRIGGARFAPDGASYVYAATDARGQFALYQGVPGNASARALGIDDATLVAMSKHGEMLVLLNPTIELAWEFHGTLARLPLAGGGPREILGDVVTADFAPDGETIAVVRWSAERQWVEYPIGQTLVESRTGWFTSLRVSPDGDRLAVVEHPAHGDDRGFVTIIERDGAMRRLGPVWESIEGLAWAPDGDQVWITASRTGSARQLVTVTLAGAEREVGEVPARLQLADLGGDGRALVMSQRSEERSLGDLRGDGQVRYLPGSVMGVWVSPDGRWFITSDGSAYVIYKVPTDGSGPAISLGDGSVQGLSTDGQWVVSMAKDRDRVSLVPIGAGTTIDLPLGELRVGAAAWFPGDGKRVLITAFAPGVPEQLYTIDADHPGPPRPLGPPGLHLPVPAGSPFSPDGSRLLVTEAATGAPVLVSVPDGAVHPAPGVEHGELCLTWTPDGRAVLVQSVVGVGAEVFEVDVATGRRTLWRHFEPLDSDGLVELIVVWLAADRKRFILAQMQMLDTLYLVEGLN